MTRQETMSLLIRVTILVIVAAIFLAVIGMVFGALESGGGGLFFGFLQSLPGMG